MNMPKQTSDDPYKDTIDPSSDSPYLTTKEAGALLKLAPSTLMNMRSRGTGPKYRKHGRLVRYHIDDLNAWSAGRGTDPASRSKKADTDE